MSQINYELPDNEAAHDFFKRHPQLAGALESLVDLCNKAFGRLNRPSCQLDDVVFESGQSCRGDYVEILFLCVGGHGLAALKLLRGLYERAVTLAYLLKHPQTVDRFIYFSAMSEYAMTKEALELFSEQELENTIKIKVSEVRANFQKALTFFGGKKPWNWDKPFAEMVKDVGGAYQDCYLGGYLLPTSNLHASLASVMRSRAHTVLEADHTLALAHSLMLLVLKNQNGHFSLNLEAEIEKTEKLAGIAWSRTPEAAA